MKGRYLKVREENRLSNDNQKYDYHVESMILKIFSGFGLSIILIPFYYLALNDKIFNWIANNIILLQFIALGLMFIIESYMMLNKSTIITMKNKAFEKSKKTSRSYELEYIIENFKKLGIVISKLVFAMTSIIMLITSRFDQTRREVWSYFGEVRSIAISGNPALILYIFFIIVGFTIIFYEVLKYISILIQNFKLNIVNPKERLNAIVAIFGLLFALIALFK